MKKIAFWVGIILTLTGIAADRHNSWVLALAFLLLSIIGVAICTVFWDDK